jgi:hypothetical protein
MFFTQNWQRFVSHNAGQPVKTVTVLVAAGVFWAVVVWLWEDWAYRRYLAKGNHNNGDGAV